MFRASILLFLLLFSSSVFAEIYKWVDQNGVVNFSDKPHSGATIVSVTENQSFSKPQSSIPSVSTEKSGHHYSAIQITRPAHQATIRNNQGQLRVKLHLEPALQKDDILVLLLNKKIIAQSQDATTLKLNGIERGEHQLQAQIRNASGKILASSAEVTIYMHKASIPQEKQ